MKTVEKNLVGVRNNIGAKDQARAAVLTIKECILGRSLRNGFIHPFIKVSDMDQIAKQEKTDILERFRVHLMGEAQTIIGQNKRAMFIEAIPHKIENLQDDILRIGTSFHLPDFMPFAAFRFFTNNDGKIEIEVNDEMIKKSIEDYCVVYAESEKEKQLLELANDIAAKLSNFKALTGLEQVENRFIVMDSKNSTIVTPDGLFEIFSAIRSIK